MIGLMGSRQKELEGCELEAVVQLISQLQLQVT